MYQVLPVLPNSPFFTIILPVVDDENQVFVKLFVTERKSTSSISSQQAVEKVKTELIAILGNLPVKNILNPS